MKLNCFLYDMIICVLTVFEKLYTLQLNENKTIQKDIETLSSTLEFNDLQKATISDLNGINRMYIYSECLNKFKNLEYVDIEPKIRDKYSHTKDNRKPPARLIILERSINYENLREIYSIK
ncbi:hypothetical protein NGRA_0972 [Nosema granulosis]|uniref:Uncharacterized protein n=1 Tax=Nosema granulosis TaxID=83296 RepID=A0A9P6H100_9MICR|nr:hypothetical protein NGRA_0972 [Nosema granulosis]